VVIQPTWKLTSFNYGESRFQHRFIYRGSESIEGQPFAWLFYLLEKEDHKVLVDTGFEDNGMASMFRVDHRSPLELLANYGLSPSDITHLVITHEHFDHNALAGEFANAVIVASPGVLAGTDHNSTEIISVTEKQEFLPGLVYEVIGGHTPQSGVLWVEEEEPFILVGDEFYLMENFRTQVISGSLTNSAKAQAFMDRLQDYPGRIFTFHDMEFAGPLGQSLSLLPELQTSTSSPAEDSP
jgi:glyoxylase-like metal-dependent hydrolase (beta-lactamase superfamily II)